MMKWGHIEVFVADPQRSKNFYLNVLGFKLTVEQEGNFLWLEKDGMELLLRPGKPPAPAERYELASTGFVFYSTSLDEEIELLKSRGLVIRGTVDTDRCFTFTDPDGNWFQMVNPEEH